MRQSTGDVRQAGDRRCETGDRRFETGERRCKSGDRRREKETSDKDMRKKT